MNVYRILSIVHSGTGILLFSLSLYSVLLSVLIAVKPAADPANERLRTRANAVGLMEQITIGIVTLSGVIVTLMSSWSLSEPWLWMSLLIVVFYSGALHLVTKPARMAVAEGGSTSKVGMQVILQTAHVLLLMIAFGLMIAKPPLS